MLAPLPGNSKSQVELRPSNPQQARAAELLVQGTQLLRERKLLQARQVMEHARSLWPESAYIHYNLGCCYVERGEFDLAVGEFQNTLNIDPRMTEAIGNIATCYQSLGRIPEAIQWFRQYLKINPHAPDADQVKGMISALERQAAKQIYTDPGQSDYLDSLMPRGKPQRWHRDRLPLKLFIANGCDLNGRPARGFKEYFNMIFLESLDTWMKASGYRLAYTVVTDHRDADITCTWTTDKGFLADKGSQVEQGVAKVDSVDYRNSPDQEIKHCDVIILITAPDGKGIISDEDVKKTCLHEIGHALGFAGHSNNNKDIMFFSEAPSVWPALTKRDKATIVKLYEDYPAIQSAHTPANAPANVPTQYDVSGQMAGTGTSVSTPGGAPPYGRQTQPGYQPGYPGQAQPAYPGTGPSDPGAFGGSYGQDGFGMQAPWPPAPANPGAMGNYQGYGQVP